MILGSRPSAAALLGVLLILVFFAGRQLLGCAYASLANTGEARSNTIRKLAAADFALRLDPDNTRYLHRLAGLRAARGDSEGALEAYRRSLRSNPAWPHTWASIARRRASLGLYDDQLRTAIDRSRELGPSERTVNYAIAVLGIDHWYRLPSDLRARVEPGIVFTLVHGLDQYLVHHIGERGRQYLYCRRFATVEGARWCRRYGIPVHSEAAGESS